MTIQSEPKNIILRRWADANGIHHSGYCPFCKGFTLYSFNTKGLINTILFEGEEYQFCAFYCLNCERTHAGARPVYAPSRD